MESLLNRITTFAFISRLCVILIQILANALIPDHQAGVFDPPVEKGSNSVLDSIVDFSFGGLRRWDAVYFTHIAQYGYTYENCVAFFPFYPLTVSLFSRILDLTGILQLQQCIILVGVGTNCVLFSLTARNLYILCIETSFDRVTSLLSVIVLCINPASIFMTAPYSESLYLFLLTLSLVYIKRGFVYRASVSIALSILTRSNGLVGIGFLLYNIAQNLITDFIILFKKEGKHSSSSIELRLAILIIRNVFKIAVSLVVCVSPFLLYQYYIYRQFCVPQTSSSPSSVPDALTSYGRLQGYKMISDNSPSPWCFQMLPFSYSYIQAKHWGVGFLKYYQFKQIPNFILAAPVVFLSLSACVSLFKTNRKAFYTLGLTRTGTDTKKVKSDAEENSNKKNDGLSPLVDQMVVYVFHLAFLTIFGCCFAHIQILTRLLFSSSPLLYWYAGATLRKNPALVSFIDNLITPEMANNKAMQIDRGQVYFTDGSSSGDHLQKTSASAQSGHLSDTSTCLSRRSLRNYNDSNDSCHSIVGHFMSSNVCVQVIVFILRNWNQLTLSSKVIVAYCISYLVIGTVMFSNYLPWT